MVIEDAAPGMVEWAAPGGFETALQCAGIEGVRIHEVTSDFVIDSDTLSRPEQLFQFSPVWLDLEEDKRAIALEQIRDFADRNRDRMVVDSPALVGVGNKH